MSNRRMISVRIANSARFLNMPMESQLLYFHLVLRADDDGVVEMYPVTKLLGVSADSIQVLFAREFIRQVNRDQVILINDWLEHNTIRADRKVNSIYKNLLPPDYKTIEPKPRADVANNSRRITNGQSTDGISKVKLSKVKLSKVKLSKVKLSNTLFWKDQKCHISPINGKIGMYDQGEWKELNENYPEDCKLLDPNGEVLAIGYDAVNQFKK